MKKLIYIGMVASSAVLAEPIKLDNVVVSATKVAQSVKDTTSNVSIITDQELQERRYVTAVDALNSMAGVGFTRNGGLGGLTKVYIRGMGGGRVLVLVDGVRYQDPSNKFGADFSRLMITDIERIELIKGAQSGIWGSDASAGVINIVTKDVEKGFSSQINTQIGSFGTKEYGFVASYGADKYSAKLSFNNYDTKGFSAQSPFGSNLENYEDDGYENRSINLLLKYNITDADNLKFNFLNIDSTNDDDTPKVGKHTENVDNSINTITNLYSLTYNKELSNQNISLKYSISDFQKDELDAKKGVRKYNGNTNEIEFFDTIKYREKDFILIGTSIKTYDVDYLKVNGKKSDYDLDSSAIFVTNTNYFDKFIFTQSLRGDDYSNFDSKLTGKLGAKYLLNKNISFSSNYGTAYNAPSMMMILNPNGKENKNLEPEDTTSFDITAQYKNLSLTYFYNEVENLISYSFKNKQHINIEGKSTFKGAEVSYRVALREDVILDLGYTRLSAKDKNSRELRRRIQDNYKFSLDYYHSESLSFNLNGEYVGKRYDGMGNTKRQTGKYFLANFVTNYQMQDNISAYLKVENLFDRYYQVVDGYSTSPRAYYIGFNLKF